jgi:DNA-binding transcriptional LysR family regulator
VKDLGRVGYGFYVCSKNRAAAARGFIGFDDSMRDTAQKQWLDAQAKGSRIVLRSNDLLAQHQAARAGIGIALLPHFLVDEADGLTPVPVEGPPFERPLALLFHPSVRKVSHLRAAIQFVSEVAKRDAGFLASGPRHLD